METRLSRSKTFLAIFAHPDDESFRPGGTLALLARRDVRVQLLTATRGEAGSCGNPPLCNLNELPSVREDELRCACMALGIEPPWFMDYQDGHLSEINPEQIISRILKVVDEVRPQVILTFGSDGLSGHPDHVVIGRCAAEAFRRNEQVSALYTVAIPLTLSERFNMRHINAVPDEIISLKMDVSSIWDTKMAAIRCHATQLSSSPILQATMEQQRLFLGTEYFVRMALRRPENDFMDQWE